MCVSAHDREYGLFVVAYLSNENLKETADRLMMHACKRAYWHTRSALYVMYNAQSRCFFFMHEIPR